MEKPQDTNIISPIDKSLLDSCIHCGLCLPACPTYLATGRELESPRGRIYLLKLWQQEKIDFSKRMAQHLDSCLGCLACQTACPSGVRYESIFNQAKVQVNTKATFWLKIPRYLALRFLLPNDQFLKLLGVFLRIWQKSHLDNLLEYCLQPFRRIKAVREFLRWQLLLPSIPPHKKLSSTPPSNFSGPAANLFKGCVMDIFYNDVNLQALQLLALQSSSVCIPEQTCCGALALHAGEKNLACQLAKNNIKKFSLNPNPIVVTGSGCAAMLKSYPELFDANDEWHNRAEALSARVLDLVEFFAKYDFLPVESSLKTFDKPMNIGYHAACHLAHAQGIRDQPKRLLEKFAETVNANTGRELIKLTPLLEEEYCCGSAGIYNLLQADLSDRILERKIAMIRASGVDCIVTTNPGCILQLETGLKKHKLAVPVLHIGTLLAKAYLNSF